MERKRSRTSIFSIETSSRISSQSKCSIWGRSAESMPVSHWETVTAMDGRTVVLDWPGPWSGSFYPRFYLFQAVVHNALMAWSWIFQKSELKSGPGRFSTNFGPVCSGLSKSGPKRISGTVQSSMMFGVQLISKRFFHMRVRPIIMSNKQRIETKIQIWQDFPSS